MPRRELEQIKENPQLGSPMTIQAAPPHRANSDVLTQTIDLAGKKVVDIGAGEGNLVRLMTRHGAKVFGVECNPLQLEKALAEKPAGGEAYHEGKAEALPFDDATIDVAVFFNSLHHIDPANMTLALAEAARVLKPQGLIYICEPMAAGPHFDLMKPVHDETHVRAKAYEAILSADLLGLTVEREFTYIHPARHKDFAQFKERMLRINPQRADDFAAREAELQAAFARLGVKDETGFVFDQPMRVDLLVKSA